VVSTNAAQGLAISPVPVNLAGLTSAQVEMVGEGSYLVNAVASCADCHGSVATGGFLAGGTPFGGAPAPFTVYARNLTPDPATGLVLTMDQFVSSLRTGADYAGVSDGGTPLQQLVVMPWTVYRWMSLDDLRSVWMYLRAIPAAKNAVTADTKTTAAPVPLPSLYDEGVLGDGGPALPPAGATDPGDVVRGLALNPLNIPAPADPAGQIAFARGAYLVNAISACNDCHTNPARTASFAIPTAAYLTGGAVFATPPPLQPVVHTVRSMSANLLGAGGGFFNMPSVTFETFLTDITQGTHAEDPHPTPLAWPMPWPAFQHMTLSDLQAIYTYASTVAKGTHLADKPTQSAALYCDTANACPPGTGTCNAEDGGTGECVGQACDSSHGDADCPACQSCVSSACTLPSTGTLAACIANGL
jgi:mono/diheme cytochrome c family protein